MEFWNIKTALFLVTLSLCEIIQPALVCATMADEKSIEELFQTYGKNNVVKVIRKKRNGKVTIEKNKSFTNGYGRPNPLFITPKSTIEDLKILEMSINELTSTLEEQKKQQEKDSKKNETPTSDTTSTREAAPLSAQLNQKINVTRDNYNKASSTSEKRRLKVELSILQSAYNRAKKNEKSKLRVYFPDKNKNTIYKKISSACLNPKTQLQKIGNPVFRHQVYFCGDREYRKQNKIICKGYSYGKQYEINEYKKDINRLREQVSANCEP